MKLPSHLTHAIIWSRHLSISFPQAPLTVAIVLLGTSAVETVQFRQGIGQGHSLLITQFFAIEINEVYDVELTAAATRHALIRNRIF